MRLRAYRRFWSIASDLISRLQLILRIAKCDNAAYVCRNRKGEFSFMPAITNLPRARQLIWIFVTFFVSLIQRLCSLENIDQQPTLEIISEALSRR